MNIRQLMRRGGSLQTRMPHTGHLKPDELLAFTPSKEVRPEALEWFARELLLNGCVSRAKECPLWTHLQGVFPFGDAFPCLDQMASCEASVAHFPMVRGDEEGRLCQVWLIRGIPAVKEWAFGVNPWSNEGISLACIAAQDCLETPPKGDSWQLAAHLARKALNDPAQRIELAAQWIVTGKVDENESICNVDGIDGKLSMEVEDRAWMVPPQLYESIRNKTLKKPARAPVTVNDAWSLVTGMGCTSSRSQEIDHLDYAEVHTLIGGSLQAPLAVALATKASKAVLWHSKKTENEAKTMKEVLNNLKPKLSVECKEMDSTNQVQGEFDLRKYFKNVNRLTLFNVTSGNRVMSFAAHSIAREFKNVRMLYRDFDSKEGEFTEFHYGDSSYPIQTFLKIKDLVACYEGSPALAKKLYAKMDKHLKTATEWLDFLQGE